MGPSNSTVECARVLSEVNRCPRDLVLWRSIGQRTGERRSRRGGWGGGGGGEGTQVPNGYPLLNGRTERKR